MPSAAGAAVARALESHGDALVSAYLFGSHAEGRVHRESDLDVAVLLDWSRYPDSAGRFEARLLLAGEIRRATGTDVDVVVLNDVPPQFARAIVTRGARLLCRDAAADHAFRRTVLSRAADLEPFLRRMRRIKLASVRR